MESYFDGKEAEEIKYMSSARLWLNTIVQNVVVDTNGRWRMALVEELLNAMRANQYIESRPIFTLEESIDPSSSDRQQQDKVIVKRKLRSVGIQVNNFDSLDASNQMVNVEMSDKTPDLVKKLKAGIVIDDFTALSDDEIMIMLNVRKLKPHDLEAKIGDDYRAVSLRRQFFSHHFGISLEHIPFHSYDYSNVTGACCENVVGYLPIPVGVVGPLMVNGLNYMIPLSTTEGALVASVNRGCRAIAQSKGVIAQVYKDAMTRAPVVQFENSLQSLEVKSFLENFESFQELKKVFDSTSSYVKLMKIEAEPVGRLLFIRFEAQTGDAMGMNMISKAVCSVLSILKEKFPKMDILALSGNFCVDKKASAVNWIKGRGKSVIAEATVPANVIKNVLKTDIDAMVRLSQAKLLIGSSLAGTLGGCNAHAANVVAGIFIATGQDVAQLVSSSMCLTTLEKTDCGDLYISCNMRCLEVGTVGGGTILPAQKACLRMLKCEHLVSSPGRSARLLAELVCSAVLAGELSLLAALCSNDVLKSHLRLNRSSRSLSKTALKSFPAQTLLPQRLCEKNEKRHRSNRLNLETNDKLKLQLTCSNIL